MATLLVHFISDFLRDAGTTAGNFGENLRCAVMLDDQVALKNYGLNNTQIGVLQTKDRVKILKQVSDEIGAVMNELDPAPGSGLLYACGLGRGACREVLELGNQSQGRLARHGFRHERGREVSARRCGTRGHRHGRAARLCATPMGGSGSTFRRPLRRARMTRSLRGRRMGRRTRSPSRSDRAAASCPGAVRRC